LVNSGGYVSEIYTAGILVAFLIQGTAYALFKKRALTVHDDATEQADNV